MAPLSNALENSTLLVDFTVHPNSLGFIITQLYLMRIVIETPIFT